MSLKLEARDGPAALRVRSMCNLLAPGARRRSASELRQERGEIRMRVLRAAAMIVLLAGPAYAQSIPKYGELSSKTPKQIEEERTTENAYKKSLGNIPDQAPTDPWGNGRSGGVAGPSTKACRTKTRTKAGGPAN